MSLMKGAAALIFLLLLQGCTHHQPQQLYRHDFVIKHPLTGKPIPYLPYQITTPDDKIFKGRTDKNGLTVEAISTMPGEFKLNVIPASAL